MREMEANSQEMEKLQNDLSKLYNDNVILNEDRERIEKELVSVRELLNEKHRMFEMSRAENEEL